MRSARLPIDLPGPDALTPGARVAVPCAPGPAEALLAAELATRLGRPLLLVSPGELSAERLRRDIAFFAGNGLPVEHFPDPEILPYDQFSPHEGVLSERLRLLHELPHRRNGIVVVAAGTLLQRLPPRDWLAGRAFDLAVGQRLAISDFRAQLDSAGYRSVSEVQAPGEYAVRGSLVDLFPMGSAQPLRIDLFDEEIDSIRVFDPETQRSVERVESVRLLPAREFDTDPEAIAAFRRRWRERFAGDPSRSRIYEQVSRGLMPAGIEAWLPLFHERTESLLDYLPDDAVVLVAHEALHGLHAEWQQIRERHERLSGDIERPLLAPDALFHDPARLQEQVSQRARVEFADARPGVGPAPLALQGTELADALRSHQGRVLFVAESAGRREAVRDWLAPLGLAAAEVDGFGAFLADHRRIGLTLGPLEAGLVLPDGSWIVAESQIFGLRALTGRRRRPVRDPDSLLRDLSSLDIGSPVVHVEHGVGRYRGLTRLSSGGIDAEYLILEYAGGDKLYVPVTDLRRIHRYTGAEGESAPLHALGSDRWRKARQRAREKVRDVAAELLQIHARRQAAQGIAIRVDEAEYRRFCEGFPFETTADQQSAIDAVLADLASGRPMDRVVCGDVGFGKTEVALRAAFAAVQAGLQVCVLAPTTLLAQQHYKNFCDRFADWPVRVAVLSRLSGQGAARTLRELAEGRIDIVIGTHRLLQDDVRLPRLGLVIVDEEHRFGVRHKERMKKLRAEVHLLTLTATPIPRTLNMSLAGLRDLSIIATPPPARLAIRTFVADWDRGLIQEACQRELHRGGQVYYVHNEVRTIERTAQMLAETNPQARVRFAHGQMRERELEQVMLDFYHQRFDILVCTTIIESGIDVPNANTILIDRADRLGLAQLHQLRGRVGRAHHQAYAYLLVPSRQAIKGEAERRLEAIEAMGDLGSGFMLATHDLEIRGAGELLGAEQSGQIEEVGFTLYAEMLGQAVEALRRGEISAQAEPIDEEIDLGLPALIPDDHVPDVHTRLSLYKRIADARDRAALDVLREELIDRFGPLPDALRNLLDLAALRIRMQALGIVRMRASDSRLSVEFGPKPNLDPAVLIRLIQQRSREFRMEGERRLHYACDLSDRRQRIPRAGELLDLLSAAESG